MNRIIAVADVGGTHARFALAEVRQGQVVSLGEPITLRTSDHASLQGAWAEFGRLAGEKLPAALGLAFAGSISGTTLKLTNSPWVVRSELLGEQLGTDEITIVNDFGAIAHAVAQLEPQHFEHCLGPDSPLPRTGLTTIVGPGTGLGVAQLLRTEHDYHVIETEGGHIDFAPLDPVDDQILAQLRQQFSRVSVERVVSGSGLANLYRAMAAIEGKDVVPPRNEMIWNAALDESDPLAVAALDRFFLSFGAVAGDLALAHGANAVVIAGGLGYRLKQWFTRSCFARRFVDKGRFEKRMESIPVKLLDHPQPGLYGAAAAFAKEHR